jgi:hypothetical protein
MGRGPEPVDAGPRLAGIRGRSRREWELLAAQLGTDHFDSILDEPNPVLHPGDDHALEPGERRRTPVGSVRAAVAPRRDRKGRHCKVGMAPTMDRGDRSNLFMANGSDRLIVPMFNQSLLVSTRRASTRILRRSRIGMGIHTCPSRSVFAPPGSTQCLSSLPVFAPLDRRNAFAPPLLKSIDAISSFAPPVFTPRLRSWIDAIPVFAPRLRSPPSRKVGALDGYLVAENPLATHRLGTSIWRSSDCSSVETRAQPTGMC